MEINWHSQESHILINPRTPHAEKNKLYEIIEKNQLNNHIFIASSGSTATESTNIKLVALKKEAFLISAQSVNSQLNCTQKDIFLNTLPHFHVGGLAMFARAQLCGGKIIDAYSENNKWNPTQYTKYLSHHKATISSLVPTQVYDLVNNGCKAPATLKTVVVGGGHLSHELYLQAKKLNWPILPSYGMTECCSQIATALPNFKWISEHAELTILPHLQVSINNAGRIQIAGESLLTGYIINSNFVDPKVNGKIITNDIGEIKNNTLFIYGRCDENIKILGENVSLSRLQNILEKAAKQAKLASDYCVISLPDIRKGQKIALVFTQSERINEANIQAAINYYNESVFPFERSSRIYYIDKIPRTELGKLKRNLILQLLLTQ